MSIKCPILVSHFNDSCIGFCTELGFVFKVSSEVVQGFSW